MKNPCSTTGFMCTESQRVQINLFLSNLTYHTNYSYWMCNIIFAQWCVTLSSYLVIDRKLFNQMWTRYNLCSSYVEVRKNKKRRTKCSVQCYPTWGNADTKQWVNYPHLTRLEAKINNLITYLAVYPSVQHWSREQIQLCSKTLLVLPSLAAHTRNLVTVFSAELEPKTDKESNTKM